MQYPLRESQLVKGGAYVSFYPDQGEYIFICKGLGKSGDFINPSRAGFTRKDNSNIIESNGFKEFRQATETEDRWLRWCIEHNKFISLDSMLEDERKNVYQIY